MPETRQCLIDKTRNTPGDTYDERMAKIMLDPDWKAMYLASQAPLKDAVKNAGNSPYVLILDIDETLDLTVRNHVEESVKRYLATGRFSPSDLPTYEDVLRAGGTGPAFAARGFNKRDADDYNHLNDEMRSSPDFQRNIPSVAPNIPRALEEAKQHGFMPVLYLTTRPIWTADVSAEENVIKGYPDLPVMGRTPLISLNQTAPWKVDQLDLLASLIPGCVIMLDDSPALSRAILERSRSKKVIPFQFMGPMTKPVNVPAGVVRGDWSNLTQQLQLAVDNFRK